jgi:type VI secretion system secreted protein Hcp
MDNDFADIFIKFDKFQGESDDQAHKKEIEVTSFSIGVDQASSFSVGQGGGVGKSVFRNLVFTAKTSIATPKFIIGCATGEVYDTVTLTARKAGAKQHDYLTWEFKKCMINSVTVAGSGSASLPDDSVSLSYTELKVSYKPQTAEGTMGGVVAAGYDLKKNVAV